MSEGVIIALVDHIYKGLGPPPPEPPADLFDHD